MEMDKKYKSSLVLGKFYGLHTGHLYLIDTALENSEVVHVLACHNPTQTIPGKLLELLLSSKLTEFDKISCALIKYNYLGCIKFQ